MRKITLITGLLFSLIASPSFAQDAGGTKPPVITLSGLPTLKKTDGRVITATTTSEYITKNPTLVVDPAGCKVVDFNVSIKVGDKSWGPVQVSGANFSDEILKQIKETKGPGVTVNIDKIRVNYMGFITSTGNDLILKYDK